MRAAGVSRCDAGSSSERSRRRFLRRRWGGPPGRHRGRPGRRNRHRTAAGTTTADAADRDPDDRPYGRPRVGPPDRHSGPPGNRRRRPGPAGPRPAAGGGAPPGRRDHRGRGRATDGTAKTRRAWPAGRRRREASRDRRRRRDRATPCRRTSAGGAVGMAAADGLCGTAAGRLVGDGTDRPLDAATGGAPDRRGALDGRGAAARDARRRTTTRCALPDNGAAARARPERRARRRPRAPRAGSGRTSGGRRRARARAARVPARARARHHLQRRSAGVGQAADAIGRRLVDARRVALHTDLELVGELDDDSVVDAQLSGQLVDPDLLGGQNAVRFLGEPVAAQLPSLARSSSSSALVSDRRSARARAPRRSLPRSSPSSSARRPGPGQVVRIRSAPSGPAATRCQPLGSVPSGDTRRRCAAEP